MTKHAPEPWEVTQRPFSNARTIKSAEGVTIAQLNGQTYPLQMDANARLIAAAPDLLEVCEAVGQLSDGQGRMNLCQVAGMARAAIAKARGE